MQDNLICIRCGDRYSILIPLSEPYTSTPGYAKPFILLYCVRCANTIPELPVITEQKPQ